jgi:asparagine N-glycosylation enzyme membrane subunit Stt3
MRLKPVAKVFGRWLILAGLLALMLATTTARHDEVFVGGQVYFVDADCYSRMSRVAQVMAHPLTSIRHQDFENYPHGIETHATAPLDWLIALLAKTLSPFAPNAIDLAGAWISPLLGLATLLLLWAWSARARLPCRPAMLLLVAVSPIIVQAFRLGRPDHQSLLLLLLAAGLAAEWNLWLRPSRRNAIVWGVAWGLALWTSLYEPLILFAALLISRLALLRGKAFSREWGIAWIGVSLVFGIGLVFDGWRVSAPAPEVAAYFQNWSQSIGELAHLSPVSSEFVGWLTWLAPALPILLGWRYAQTREPRLLAILVLLLATYGLTCWQIRWGCYLALVAAMALPFALAAIPSRAFAWIAFAFALLPIAKAWDTALYPDEPTRAAREEQKEDYAQLRQVALARRSTERTGILAPWWLSPPLAYWSDQPTVAGSSHESLPGTVDTARFYLATDEAVAREIVQRRNIRYVVAYEPDRVVRTSVALLGERPTRSTLAEWLYRGQSFPWLTLVYSTPWYKIYEVKRDGL